MWVRRLLEWLLLISLAGFAARGAAGPNPLNVVIFLADDLGQRDLGCYGSTFYETPHLDRLAQEGARFTHAYAACPVCSPTRASLLTGQWPARTGITDYIGAPNQPELWKRNTRSLPAPFADRLSLESPTLAKTLKAAGYATFFAGKWHLGPEGWWPENQGFDVNRGGIDRGGPYGGNKYFSPYGNPRLTDGPPGEHLADRLAAETVAFIESHTHQPFLAYVSFYDVHTPLMAKDALREKYQTKRKRLRLEERWGREEPRDVRLTQDDPVYAAMVETLDSAVGQVLKRLDELKLSERTVVIFTSDNGGLSTSEGWPTSNVPWRGGKGWLYEGGLREPLLIRWPGVSRPGSVITVPVSSPDLFPTVLSAARLKPPDSLTLDGLSLVPALLGRSFPDRPLFWHYPHYGNQGGAPSAAIRRGEWKLIEWLEDGRVELYQLARDPSERSNLAPQEPDRVAALQAELHAWQQQVGAKFPVPNPNFNPGQPNGRDSKRP